MLILAATLLALALVPLFGGRLSRLSGLRLRQGWLVALALALQVVCITLVPTWPRPILVTMHALSYLLAAAFVWLNRRLPGLAVLALGGLCNAVTIGLNGGTLPASPSAMRRAGLPVVQDKFLNSGLINHPRLAFLGDNYPSPSWLPLHNVYSLGDLLILAGAVWMIHRTCGTALTADPRPRLRAWVSTYDDSADLPILEELRRERDEALAEVRGIGARNDELSRELARMRLRLRVVVHQVGDAPVTSDPAAATFASGCAGEDVPGIGSMVGA
jgi:uncharacterized membrane protein